jgi:hypothetical protein
VASGCSPCGLQPIHLGQELAAGPRDREALLPPGRDLGPAPEIGELHPRAVVVPGRSVLVFDPGGNLAFLPEVLVLPSHRAHPGLLAGVVALHVEGAVAREQEPEAQVAHGHAPAQAERVRVAVFQDRVPSPQGVGVLDHVAHPHVLEEQDGRQRAVVDLVLELALPLDGLDLPPREPIERLALPEDPHLVEDQDLVGGIEVDGELRGVREAGAVHDLPGVVPVAFLKAASHPGLPIDEQVVDPPAHLGLRGRRRREGHVHPFHPGRRLTHARGRPALRPGRDSRRAQTQNADEENQGCRVRAPVAHAPPPYARRIPMGRTTDGRSGRSAPLMASPRPPF